MKQLLHYISILLYTIIPLNIFGQGLKFKGNECLIQERTSYNVFNKKEPTFSEKLNISFDISLLEPSQFGYLIRIKNEANNVTYNIFYDNQGDATVFKFNEEGKSSLITARIEKNDLMACQWFRLTINFDLKNDSLTLNIKDEVYHVKDMGLPEKWKPVINFGKSDHIIDVPSFAIKDLIISDNNQKYTFPLTENEGNLVHSQNNKTTGYAINPVWLINDAYYWSHKTSFKSKTIAGTNFNPSQENIYFFNSDSIYIYNVRNETLRRRAINNENPMDMALGTNFIDNNNDLYTYEVYSESEEQNKTSITRLNFSNYEWQPVSDKFLPMQLHHHTAHYDSVNNRYIIFGGFGNMKYNREILSYDLIKNQWDTLYFEGEKIAPRYFSSMGYLPENNSLYIFGGMGNESGEQIVGRRYFYDLYKIDLTENKITKLWEIPWHKENVVPVRGMVIPNDSCFYTLCYPEHFTKTFLKLYCFSMKDGSFEIMGDSIPILSDKIKTNTNIYFDKKLNKLHAIVQEFEDEIASEVNIYSLSFPPVTLDELYHASNLRRNYLTYLLFLVIILVTGIILYIVYKRTRKSLAIDNKATNNDTNNISELKHTKITDKANSIYLFGDFTVRDKQNKDITYMFSSRLKQAFFLLLQYNFEGGITSQRFSELLWPDKPEDKVKNSRGVTINHLRKILKELNGIELIHEKGAFKIRYTNGFYCDYIRCLELISSEEDIVKNELTEIVERGKFLKGMDSPLFDSFKDTVERKIEPVLLIEMENSFKDEDYYSTISLSKAIFDIDPINEDAIYYLVHALSKLKMHDELKKYFLTFSSEYKNMIGKEYPTSLTNMLNSFRQ